MTGNIELQGTGSADHAQQGHPYVVALPPEIFRLAGRPPLVVLERTLASSINGTNVRIPVIARAVLGDDLHNLSIRIDQTLRVALGYPQRLVVGSTITVDDLAIFDLGIRPIDRLRNRFSAIIGRRYVLARVTPARPSDLEKRLCRVPGDVLSIIGVSHGSRVVLAGAKRTQTGGYELARMSIQILAIDEHLVTERRAKEQASSSEGWNARFVDPVAVVLGASDTSDVTDLDRIFLDRDGREWLGAEQAFPILIRRDSASVVSDELLEFGVTLLASLLALNEILTPLLSPLDLPVLGAVINAVAALTITSGAILLRLRSKLR